MIAWDLENNNEPIDRLELESRVTAIVASKQSNTVYVATWEDLVIQSVLREKKINVEHTYNISNGPTCLCLDSSENVLISGLMTGEIVELNLNTKEKKPIHRQHGKQVNQVGLTKNEDSLVSCSDDKTLIVWTFHSQEVKTFYHLDLVTGFALSSDEQYVYTSSVGTYIEEWDLGRAFLNCKYMKGHNDAVNCIKMNQADNRIFSGSCDHQILLWKRTVKPLKVYFRLPYKISSFKYDARPLQKKSPVNTQEIAWDSYPN